MVAKALADLGDRRAKAAVRHRQHPLVVLELGLAFALRADAVGTAVGGTPIDGDEAVRPARVFSHESLNGEPSRALHRFSFPAAALSQSAMVCDSRLHCVADVRAVLGEGPVWVARESALYWLDIKGFKVFRRDEKGAISHWPTPLRVGSLVPRKSGGFIGGMEHGIAVIDLEAASFDIVADPEKNLPGNRFNDGKVDRRGRFWAGTMDDAEKGATGSLYCVDPDFACTQVDRGYKVTNGPSFSPSGDRMYHNDSGRQVTYVFDMEDGRATNRRVFQQFAAGDGSPDGMTVDSE